MGSEPRWDDRLALLATPPPDEYALLELTVEWDQLVDVEAQLASALRVLVITRDPLDWLPRRGHAWATANADGDGLELPVYIVREELDRRIEAHGGDPVATIGALGASVVTAASACQGIVFAGGYPELAFREQVPRLLAQEAQTAALGTPEIAAVSTGWEPIGLGAVQDLVQDAFGPVSFDRSEITLAALERTQPGCPACAGHRFGFPGDLSGALVAMCPEHRAEAEAVTTSRITRARASNPAGWRAIAKGSARVSGLPEPAAAPAPRRRGAPSGRNEPCPCGSGRKYKQCCGK